MNAESNPADIIALAESGFAASGIRAPGTSSLSLTIEAAPAESPLDLYFGNTGGTD